MSLLTRADTPSSPLGRIRRLPVLSSEDEGRFWSSVDRPKDSADLEPCWEWSARRVNGYGQFRIRGQMYYSHRVSYALFFGDPWPLVLDHVCENGVGGCVNPVHLDPVTQAQNVMRAQNGVGAINARKTHCVRGHEFTPENTIVGRNPNGRRARICRTCRRLRAAKYRKKSGV